ncbi:MAG TPA: hypothetical protein VHS03_03590 [Gaiellaceae bacterium]|jgi:hypothetical protein|nr:hypothetical protein [Gaiellaceae bacterium]
MRGFRWWLRDFTSRAVREHLRSQAEDRDSPPELTPNEVELVRELRDGSFDWDSYLAKRPRD